MCRLAPGSAIARSLALVALVAVTALLGAADASARTGRVELGAAVNDHGFLYADSRYRGTLEREYDAVTAESAYKMVQIQPERGRYDFSLQDQMLDWAQAKGKRMHGHTLVWCADEWSPSWLVETEWTRDELIAVLEDHIRTVVGRYRGRVATWDVVNEAFDNDGSRRDCVWSRVIGPEYVEMAFRIAHEADPDARLFLNEYNADIVNSHFRSMESLAKDFLARGVPLHGIGLQMHLFGPSPPQYRIEEAIARVAALGLDVHVSELDDKTSHFGVDTTEEKLALQGQAYQTVAAACQAQPACFRLTTWGFTDNYSFRGPAEMALPWDYDYLPKPAWRSLQQAFGLVPAPAGNRAPSAPTAPAADAGFNRGSHTLRWSPSTDPDGHPVSYVLEHRDADDSGWSTIASGIRGTSYAFAADQFKQYPEPQGTWRYRVRASDGWADSATSPESAPVVVDRAVPSSPRIDADRAPEWTDWYRASVTLSFADGGDGTLPDGSPGAGVDPASLPAARTFTTTGAQTVSGTATDRAGNVSASASRTVRVDATAPAVTLTCPSKVQQGAKATASWSASDVGSGLATPASGSFALDTSVAGTRTASTTARDNVGLATTTTCVYQVTKKGRK